MNTRASSEGAITRAAGSEEEELLPHRSSEPTSIAISSSNPCASMVAALPVMLLGGGFDICHYISRCGIPLEVYAPLELRPNQRLMGSCSEPVPFQAIR